MAKKLTKMDPVQAIYAESLINNILRKGLLKKLTEETDICDNYCNKTIRTPSSADLHRTSSISSDVSQSILEGIYQNQEETSLRTFYESSTDTYQ